MKAINRILIANRGEIVSRIMRTAHDSGMEVIVLYTNDDKDHAYLKKSDHVVLLEGASLSETFLNKEKIIDIALSYKADAVHPGYGFLSENADFAAMCRNVGLIWVGPSPEVIRLMGYKKSAREFAEKNDVPVLKAHYGTADELMEFKNEMQFPVMIKAQAGGGGKGMRIVHDPKMFEESLLITGREGMMFFGDAALYVEEFVEKARHIEVQVLGDNFGNVVHLFERECTVQRRHQKLIEEAPATNLGEKIRSKMHESAVKLAKAAKYVNAGTVEFIVDKDAHFYFLEMNTRIQVEHPVTEIVTGIDVVKEQLLVAANNELRFTQEEVICRGHALECRLYAEDPENGFMPQNGTLTLNAASLNKSVRVDGSFERTAHMSSAYDPLIAKVITEGKSRLEAMKNMIGALEDYKIQGVKTNKGFLTNLLNAPVLIQNNIYTQYCDLYADKHFEASVEPDERIAIAWYFIHTGICNSGKSVYKNLGNWRHQQHYMLGVKNVSFNIHAYPLNKDEWQISVNGNDKQCQLIELSDYTLKILIDNEPCKYYWSESHTSAYHIELDNQTFLLEPTVLKRVPSEADLSKKSRNIVSPLPGRVMRVYVSPGEKIEKGKAMLVIESMKIENRIVADHDSTIKHVLVSEGQQLNGNELVIELE